MPPVALEGVAVLVTGGAGFIGSHLVDALVGSGARVRVLDDLSTGRPDNLADRADEIELIEGDVRDAGACRRAAAGVELLFHQAALGSVPRSLVDPATTLAVNVQGTANVLTAAREAGVRRVVYASSSSVYGDSPRLPKREGEEGEPLSPYAASKRMTEQLAAVLARCYRLPVVGLRYFNVYGPRQDPAGPYAAVVPRFLTAGLTGGAPQIYGDGRQTRDFTYVADAVCANLLAAAAPVVDGRALNVAGGRGVSILELARLVGRLTGNDRPPEHRPPRPGDVPHSTADLERARAELGYQPRADLEEGLAATRRYYAARLATAAGGRS